ncbi:MAG: hypothetical protein JW950_07635 [Deltaproteobacteria bacterium]|nr:hypothetical protein [Deltaproteobacteria bacterium]
MTLRDKKDVQATAGSLEGVRPDLLEALKARSVDGRIACAEAERIARNIGTAMIEVGRALDLMGIAISRCQLGLFGYSPEKKIVKPAGNVAPKLANAIAGALSEGRLSCSSAWEIAGNQGISRMEVSSACEAQGIKIKHCQLGAF